MGSASQKVVKIPSAQAASKRLRFVTAASLFDGHDASINIMRRIAQSCGAEVIHLGHNRSVAEIVDAAIQEDAQGIAISSYQGGHNEYFRYILQLLQEGGASHIRVFGGGGGVRNNPQLLARTHDITLFDQDPVDPTIDCQQFFRVPDQDNRAQTAE